MYQQSWIKQIDDWSKERFDTYSSSSSSSCCGRARAGGATYQRLVLRSKWWSSLISVLLSGQLSITTSRYLSSTEVTAALLMSRIIHGLYQGLD